jgi:hypothetical protein
MWQDASNILVESNHLFIQLRRSYDFVVARVKHSRMLAPALLFMRAITKFVGCVQYIKKVFTD